MKTKKNKSAEEAEFLAEGRIRECFGEDVVGMAQRMTHNVSGVRRMEDGGVLATVLGGGEQVTYVGMGKDGVWVSECTCAAGCDCVHAASLALVWADCVRRDRVIPPIDPTDARLRRLDGEEPPKGSPLYENAEAQKAIAYLEHLDALERYYLLLEHMEKNPRFLKEMTIRAVVSNCTDKELISTTKKAIKDVCSVKDRVQDVDFSMVEHCLTHLLERKQYDALVGICELLVKETTKLLRRFFLQDSGIYSQVKPCMELCMKGVEECSLSEGERLEWDFRIRKMGKKTLFGDFPSMWDKPDSVSTKAWAYVAKLWTPIFRGKQAAPYEITEKEYQKTLLYSKTEDERISDRIQDVERVGDYDDLARHLLDGGRLEEAEAICRKGLMRGFEGRHRVKNREGLIRLLVEVFEKRGDEKMALAIAVEGFLQLCSYEMYQCAREKAEPLMMVSLVEEQLKNALRLGKRPKKLRAQLPDSGFPETSLSLDEVKRYDLLFQIVALEEDEEALLDVWTKMKSLNIPIRKLSESTREEVAERYPEDILDYWFECLQEDALKGSDTVYTHVENILEAAGIVDEDGWLEKIKKFAKSKKLKPSVRYMIEDAIENFY